MAANTDFCEVAFEESPIEELANTAVTPNRISTSKLYVPSRSVVLAANPQHLDRGDELRGITGAVARLIDSYEPGGSLSMRMYGDPLIYLMHLMGFTGVYTAGNGVITDPDGATIPTGAARWVFNKHDAIVPQTAQIKTNYKDEDVLVTGNGYAIANAAFNAAGELTADLIGLVVKKAAHDAATNPAVASSAIPPFRRGDLFLTWLGGGGEVSDFSFTIASGLERIRTLSLNPPSYFPDQLEYADDQVQITGSIPKRILNQTDFAALLAATTFAGKARWVSPKVIGATAYKYSMWVEMAACQYVGGGAEDLGNKRRHGATFDFFSAYDEAAGYDTKITIVGSVTSSIFTYV